MLRRWQKMKERVSSLFGASRNNDYAYELLANLERVQEKEIAIPFVIESVLSYGFLVKIGGLNATISFDNMPWRYNSKGDWQVVSPHLIGKEFYGEVTNIISTNIPFRIRVSAKSHVLKSKKLILYKEYKVVVISKKRYGVFIDVGYHFQWKYGSVVSLIHKSAFPDLEDYEQAQRGQVISTYFHGRGEDDKLVFGKLGLQQEWLTGELEELVGTMQKITVTVDDSGRKRLLVKNKFDATLTAYKAFYPKSYIRPIREFKRSLMPGDSFEAEIFKIGKRRHFILRLVLESLEDIKEVQ